MKHIAYLFCLLSSYIYPYKLHRKILQHLNVLFTLWISREFKSIGKNTRICRGLALKGGKCITIGNKVTIGSNTILAAHTQHNGMKFTPSIEIGDNVNIGQSSNISCINRIKIGDGVRMGRRIMLNDNSHGTFDRDMLDIQPNLRPLVSKGPIIIEENVWIGEKVCILSGVHIGKGSIIGAGSIVTKDIPAYSFAAGMPAKVIKQLS